MMRSLQLFRLVLVELKWSENRVGAETISSLRISIGAPGRNRPETYGLQCQKRTIPHPILSHGNKFSISQFIVHFSPSFAASRLIGQKEACYQIV